MNSSYPLVEPTNSTGHCFPTFHDDSKCVILLALRSMVAAVSMVCSVFIVALIILFKKYRFLPQRLILYLSISAFFQALVYGTANFYTASLSRQGGSSRGFCILQAYWTLFFDWAAFIWVLCITFNVVFSVIFVKKERKAESFEKFYIIIDLAVPAVICCFPFIQHSYGPAGLWCWISSLRDGEPFTTGIILQFVLFYCPLWLLSLVMLLALIIVFFILQRRKSSKVLGREVADEVQEKIWREDIRPIIFFPFVYMVILIFPSMNRLRLAGGFIAPESGANFFFWLMHSITLPLHGTAYAFLFGLDKQTLSRIRWTHIKAAFKDHYKKPTEDYPVIVNCRRETYYVKDPTKPNPRDDKEEPSYQLVVD